MNGLEKCQKKKSRWLFEIIHIIRFEMRMDSRINLKIFLGYDINYLSIWPFMHHTCFPTGKVSKVVFFLFQFQLFSPCIVLKEEKCHFWDPSSRKTIPWYDLGSSLGVWCVITLPQMPNWVSRRKNTRNMIDKGIPAFRDYTIRDPRYFVIWFQATFREFPAISGLWRKKNQKNK